MENHKQLISCRVLTRFIIFWQGYITIYYNLLKLMLFRMFPCLHVSWYTPDVESREAEKAYFGCSLEWNNVLSRSQCADKAGNKNVVQKGQSDIVSTLLTNQVTLTRVHACVAIGCARPPTSGADRVLQSARNSHHWSSPHYTTYYVYLPFLKYRHLLHM